MAGDMLPQVLEEMNSLPFEARPAVEGEVKQLDPVAYSKGVASSLFPICRVANKSEVTSSFSINGSNSSDN